MLIGSGLIYSGISIYNNTENILAKILVIPVSATIGLFGIGSILWGGGTLFFGSKKYAKEYKKISSLPTDEQESTSAEFLKSDAANAKQKRKPKLWNLFGLLSFWQTPVAHECNAYKKDMEIK